MQVGPVARKKWDTRLMAVLFVFGSLVTGLQHRFKVPCRPLRNPSDPPKRLLDRSLWPRYHTGFDSSY